jgi:predicted RNase H-like HicB family nuclease
MAMTFVNPETLNTAEDGPRKGPTLVTKVQTPKVAEVPPGEPEPSSIRLRLAAQYAEAAVRHARYEALDDDQWYADVVGLDGVWAEGGTVAEAEAQLREVIESWVLLAIELDHGDIPPMEGLDLNGL